MVSGKVPLRKLRPRNLSPRKLPPQKIAPYENSPYEYSPMKVSPCENYPEKFAPKKIAPCENPDWENYPQWNPIPTYKTYKWKKKQNYKIFCQESSAIQHPYQNNQGPFWYTNDLTGNTGLRYFLYRMKKFQKSNEMKITM